MNERVQVDAPGGPPGEAVAAEPSFAARARHRLRREPPGFSDRRGDLNGDHMLDPESWGDAPAVAPRIAAVLVPVLMRAGEPTLILTERAAGLRNHGGQIAFPGGRMDPQDASPLDAALREAEEEIGLDRANVTPLGYLDSWLTGTTNFFILPVVAAVRPGAPLVPNPAEVASVFEVPLSFLMNEASHQLHTREEAGRARRFYAMPFGERYIWGATAGIIRNMYERLYRADPTADARPGVNAGMVASGPLGAGFVGPPGSA